MANRRADDALLRVIRSVRRRWRTRVLLRGAAIVLAAGLAIFLVSAYGMDRTRFDPMAVLAFRIFAYAALVLLVLRFLIRPLWRRVSDERVALYLEENEPSLETRLLSAIEFGGLETEASETYSPALVGRLIESASEKCVDIDFGRRVDSRALRRSSGLLLGTTAIFLAILLLSPPFLRHSTPFLLFPWSGDELGSPYSIQVSPGNTKIARGADLKVTAQLENFDADEVEIAVRRGAQGEWERLAMAFDDEVGDYSFFLFDLDEESEYFVEASKVRSSLFRIEVSDLPFVRTLVLEYHFPAYTGLQPRRQEDGGDIAALRGTEVRMWVTPTVQVTGGAIVVEDQDSLPLVLGEDGTLTGSLKVARDGLYRIVFESLEGDAVVGSPDFLIDVLSDQPPMISFRKPGRDIKATNIEEVFVEVEAEDDYGLSTIELIYSVNGGEEETLELYSGVRKDVSAGHTFYLEEIELQPGDFISYYARATDSNRVSGHQISTTDIYFMEIRPFDRRFRQAEQAPGAPGGGFDSSLSQQQRDIIAATFKMVRDREEYTDKEYHENLATLALAQGRLREQVENLVRRMNARGIVDMDSSFRTIAEALPIAAREMGEAEQQLGERQPKEALSPEQRALQQLQRAEAAFRDVQVGHGAQGSGGSGASIAEDLADLFELELDKQRNQYESLQRSRQRETDDQIDETLQKLQELARRQQQENERLRARSSDGQNQAGAGGAGGAGQRRLAEEAEELARRLERLAREQSLPELNQTAQELRRAADDMRRAAATNGDDGLTEGLSALERLRDARRLLDENRSSGLKRDIEDALRRAERLAQQQSDVTSDVEQLAETGPERMDQVRRLIERKEEMAGEVADLEADLDRTSRESRKEQRDASRKLQEAANTIRDDKLKEKIRYSRGVVQGRSTDYARNFEEQIGGNIDTVREKIEEALDAIGESKEQRLARTLEETRDLARSLESLDERISERAEQRAAEGERSEGAEEAQAQNGPARGSEAQASGADAGRPLDAGEGGPRLSRGDVRQFRREFQERREEAERLRQELAEEGIDAGELDAVIERLRQLERERSWGDVRGLSALQTQVILGLKEFEYALRRELGAEGERDLLLSGSDEVPPGYRELVEEYYRSLAGDGDSR